MTDDKTPPSMAISDSLSDETLDKWERLANELCLELGALNALTRVGIISNAARNLISALRQEREKVKIAKEALDGYAKLPGGSFYGPDDVYTGIGNSAKEALEKLKGMG